jgi:hypothetical protein
MRPDVHARGVPPQEERFVRLLGPLKEIEGPAVTSSSIVSMRLMVNGPVSSMLPSDVTINAAFLNSGSFG